MAKLKNPLLSLRAAGRLTKDIVFVNRRLTNIAEKKPIPKDVKSLLQLDWRHMYQKAVLLWHALSAAEKQEWESLARPKHMTGFAWFISQALKPNPGLYLPLQGGTMSGEIDMAKYRIRRLPVPEGVQDPLRVHEYNTAIAPFLLKEGARAYHSVGQSIPNATWTVLALDSERYDTDTIHDCVTNNSRLTCKTAGPYIICANAAFTLNTTGNRNLAIRHSVAGYIGMLSFSPAPTQDTICAVAAIYDLAVDDYVEMLGFQQSGGALTSPAHPQHSPEFMMQRIG